MKQLTAGMLGAAAAGCLLTAAVVVAPFARVAYREPELHIAIETAAALSAGLVAYLFLGRFRDDWRLRDLLLVAALGVLAGSNLFFSTLPALVHDHGQSFSTWASISGVLVGAALFASSALAPRRRLSAPCRAAAVTLVACAATLAAIAVLAAHFRSKLPLAIDPTVSPASGDLLTGEPAILTLQVVAMLLFAAAAVGFGRDATRSGDELTGSLALGAVFAALARLDYLLFPSQYSEWVYLGDAFRLAFYVVLLVGALREIRGYQHRLAEAAVLEERRRLARELHDGLAQELAFLSVQSRRLAQRLDPSLVDDLVGASGRALDESRGAISSLTRPLDEPFDSVIADAAEQLRERHGVKIGLDLDPSVDVPIKAREALRRIVREAVANAVRHGKATTVTVAVSNQDATCCLRITDNGAGFDPRRPDRPSQGFGLVSMRERAAAIGAQMHVRSHPGEGVEVEVVLP